jgi:DMSO/TMAO reductase YedYZ heme-binding membrane subunit
MKKMYKFYCLFLFGNLLPFLIIELYFQDYFTIGIIIFIASIALIICSSIEYLKIKSMTQSDNKFKKIDYINLLERKDLDKLASFYFFRKNFL